MGYLDKAGLRHFTDWVRSRLSGKQDALTPDESIMIQDGNIGVSTPVRGIVTQAEYDALPEAERNKGLYVISDGGSGGGSAGEVYSTEETRIGTWINGKPLYRRVFETSIAAMGSYENIVSFPNSYETKTLKGYVSVSGGIVPVPSYSSASNIGTYLYSVSGGVSAYTTNKAHVNTTCTVIVEYTKATDEGGTS